MKFLYSKTVFGVCVLEHCSKTCDNTILVIVILHIDINHGFRPRTFRLNFSLEQLE